MTSGLGNDLIIARILPEPAAPGESENDCSIICFNVYVVCSILADVKTGEFFNLSGQTAVVIGATGVLGGALAQGLATAGAKVAVLGRNVARGEARVREILSHG